MAHVLIVGKNTYATEAEATAFLESRLRSATAWAALTSTVKAAALSSAFYLMEGLPAWRGTKSEVTELATVAIGAGGTGYVVNDLVTLVGGSGTAAIVKVTAVSAGVVTALQLVHTGFYTTTPSGTLSTTGGTGTGLTVTFTALDHQPTAWPRTGTEVDGAEDDDIPTGLKNAQAQLAYELSQDTELEAASNANANIASMGVGSLQISYFRSETRSRFPTIVWDLLRPFIGGDGSDAAPRAYGGDGESSFSDANPYGIGRGGY